MRLIVAQPVTFVVTVLANVVFGLILGSIFFNVDETEAGAFSRVRFFAAFDLALRLHMCLWDFVPLCFSIPSRWLPLFWSLWRRVSERQLAYSTPSPPHSWMFFAVVVCTCATRLPVVVHRVVCCSWACFFLPSAKVCYVFSLRREWTRNGRSFLGFYGRGGKIDLHVLEAKVREALEFSAALRGGREVSDAVKKERVEDALDKLQLRAVQDELVLALSPSQLKKLTIGCELVGIGSDAILFLDEPTSGLDARDALSVITGLQLIAADRVAIVCTVHQPSKELFASFDRLLLLSRGGKMVYMGDLNAAEGEPHSDVVSGKLMAYFEDHGAEALPPGRNPADHMVRFICGLLERCLSVLVKTCFTVQCLPFD